MHTLTEFFLILAAQNPSIYVFKLQLERPGTHFLDLIQIGRWTNFYVCDSLNMTDNKQRKVQAGWLSLFSFFENDLQQTHCVTNFPSSDEIEQ